MFTPEEAAMIRRLLKRHIIDCQDVIPASRNAVKEGAEAELAVCQSAHEKLMCIK